MSIPFNSTDGKGIIQLIENELGFNTGDISENATLLKQFTAYINVALDEVWSIILPASGTWQFDDLNYDNTNGGYPIITADLVSGQRDYTFTVDGSGNVILDVYKVFVKDRNGTYNEVTPVDQQSERIDLITSGTTTSGVPTQYDKTANGIIFDYVPNYNSDEGVKMLINREGLYFLTTDTTKKPGFAGIFHEYLVINPAYKYASGPKQLPNQKSLLDRKLLMEERIRDYYSDRVRDEKPRLRIRQESTR